MTLGKQRYGHNIGGLVTNVTYPGGLRVRYGYDADGRVTNVTDWAGHAWTFTRDAAGRLTALNYPAPSGVSGSWTYDANHKVSGWSYNNGSPLAGRTITRDDAGVKVKEQVTAGLFPNPQSPRRAANTFDAADRLVSATLAVGTNTYAESYLYDGNGTLTNRQSTAGDQQFEYDCAGRLTYSQQSTAYSLSLTYDALGNRLTTYSANATRIWITDHADPRKRPLMEADANGEPVRYFIWGGGLLLAVVEADGTMRYCHSDEQGSVVALTDSNGTVTDQYCYGPYGTDWGHSGTNNVPFRWLGSHGVFNVGGGALHLTRYRAYDASLCRFLSQDPLGLGGGPNLYSYCLGSPLAYIDPLGLGGESVNNTSPWELGFQWLTGFGPRDQDFTDNDPMTGMLQQHSWIQETRNLIANNIATGGDLAGYNNYNLGGVQGVPKYVADYSTLLTAGLTGNLAVTYLGSYSLNYNVTSINPQSGTATVIFTVANSSTIASATHPPVVGYTPWWDQHVATPLNNFFQSGPMSPTTQTFTWTETIYWAQTEANK